MNKAFVFNFSGNTLLPPVYQFMHSWAKVQF
uniref:Uncharacterized protein n=1 Tax=Anguilla anguilla TaxID=7936 RepID=A0A0E9RTQ5_ANGAN